MRRVGYIWGCEIAAKGYCLCPVQEKKGGGGHVQAMGVLLEDQITKCTFLKETNTSNERKPNLRANFLET